MRGEPCDLGGHGPCVQDRARELVGRLCTPERPGQHPGLLAGAGVRPDERRPEGAPLGADRDEGLPGRGEPDRLDGPSAAVRAAPPTPGLGGGRP